MRRDYQLMSSETYYIPPTQLRALGLELMYRTRDKAFTSHPEYEHLTQEERGQVYDRLKEQIQIQGFQDEFPIIVMLLRKSGQHDKILHGHHRLNIAIELNLPTVPVRFVY